MPGFKIASAQFYKVQVASSLEIELPSWEGIAHFPPTGLQTWRFRKTHLAGGQLPDLNTRSQVDGTYRYH